MWPFFDHMGNGERGIWGMGNMGNGKYGERIIWGTGNMRNPEYWTTEKEEYGDWGIWGKMLFPHLGFVVHTWRKFLTCLRTKVAFWPVPPHGYFTHGAHNQLLKKCSRISDENFRKKLKFPSYFERLIAFSFRFRAISGSFLKCGMTMDLYYQESHPEL